MITQKEHKKVRNQQENKKLGKEEVRFSSCLLYRMGIMGNGAEKAWNEQFILKWIKATDFGQSRICQDCDKVRMWALNYFKACSKLCKVRKTNLLLQLTQGKLLCDNFRNLGQTEQGKAKISLKFTLLFSKLHYVPEMQEFLISQFLHRTFCLPVTIRRSNFT